MVAMVLCEKIADERFTWFSENEAWDEVQKSVQDGHINGFKDKVDSLIDTCLGEYHETTRFFDDNVRKKKQTMLIDKLLKLIEPVGNLVVGHIGSETLEEFKEEYDASVKHGVDLSKAACVCTATLHVRFDEECADAAIKLAKWDLSVAKAALLLHANEHVISATKDLAQQKAEFALNKLQQKLDEQERARAKSHKRIKKGVKFVICAGLTAVGVPTFF